MALLLLILASIVMYYLFLNKEISKDSTNPIIEKRCTNCRNVVERGFNVCPICKETLKKKCASCGELVDTSWKYCPYCENLLTKCEQQ